MDPLSYKVAARHTAKKGDADEAEAAATFKEKVHKMTREMLDEANSIEKFAGRMERWTGDMPTTKLWKEIPEALQAARADLDRAAAKLREHARKLGT